MNLGEIIKIYRDENNLSMQQFGDLAEISKQYVSVLEKNKDPRTGKPITPSISVIDRIARAMDMSFDALFNQLDDDLQVIINADSLDSNSQELLEVYNELNTSRQNNVFKFAKQQLHEQINGAIEHENNFLLAAHIDDGVTDEQLQEINDFIEKVKKEHDKGE